MTLEEMRTSTKPMLTPAEVAPVIGCDPHAIRLIAHSNPASLGFPVCVVRSRTLIPREPFLAFVTGPKKGE